MDRFFKAVLIAAAAALGVAFGFAIAAAAAQSVDTKVSAKPLVDLLQPYLLAMLNIVGMVVIGWAARLAEKYTGIRVTAEMREQLDRGLMNAAGAAYAKFSGPIANATIDVRHPLVATAYNHLIGGNAAKEAIDRLGVSPDRLKELLVSKIGILQATSVPASGSSGPAAP